MIELKHRNQTITNPKCTVCKMQSHPEIIEFETTVTVYQKDMQVISGFRTGEQKIQIGICPDCATEIFNELHPERKQRLV